MKKPGHVSVLYMSGTGNTARAAAIIAKELKDAGWMTELAEIRRGAPLPVHQPDLLVLCFPVLGYGMPALVRRGLRGLRGHGAKAAVFATWGGEPGAALWQARGLLRRKGYKVTAAAGTVYPFQWTQMMAPTEEDEVHARVASGDADARAFARALLKRGASPLPGPKPRPLAVALGLLVVWPYALIGRRGLAAMFAADARCTACGNCARDCPAAAIEMAGRGDARRPRWRYGCQGCNRCINLCPREAVQTSPLRAAIHLLLGAAVMTGIVVGLNHGAAALRAPQALTTPACIALLLVLMVLGSWLQFVAMEPVLFRLESIPALRRSISRSWTARFGRYRCTGFKPSRLG